MKLTYKPGSSSDSPKEFLFWFQSISRDLRPQVRTVNQSERRKALHDNAIFLSIDLDDFTLNLASSCVYYSIFNTSLLKNSENSCYYSLS